MTTKKKKFSSAALQSVEASKFLEKQTGPLTAADMLELVRLCKEMFHAEFARMLGISRANLCDIEKGRKLLSPGRALTQGLV